MKQFVEKAEILRITPLTNSVDGCPRWELKLLFENAENSVFAKTQSCGRVAWLLGYSDVGKKIEFTYHLTKSGNLIIDDVEK